MTPTGKASSLFFAAAFFIAGAQAGQADENEESAGGRPAEIQRAIAAGVKFLSSHVGSNGSIAGEYSQADRRRLFGGKTSLCAYALLAAGEDQQHNAALRRAVDWLIKARLDGVYPVAMRACALSGLSSAVARTHLEADVRWLVAAANGTGAYTYTHQHGRGSSVYDNSSSQIAVAGVWAGVSRGIDVPKSYWRTVRQHWLDQQQPDGGWGYCIHPGQTRTKTYGSMTAAGLATLYACFDVLQAEQFVQPGASGDYEPITRGMDWLAANFRADENPRHGVEWYHYWLFCVQRVGLASGYKYLGAQDWYSAGVAQLLRARHDDGSWGDGDPADRIVPTAFATLFLARGWHPVLFNKLQYPGSWNARPRDLANLTSWLSYTLEKPVNWQVVGLNSSLEDWHDAPMLYISGTGACELTESQVRKLRDYVLQGGMVLSESAGNSGTFTLQIGKLYKKLFPDWPLTQLSDKHPIYSVPFASVRPVGLSAVSNGIRLLAIHSPREVSSALQLVPGDGNLPTFQLMANIYLYATDRGVLRPRGVKHWPQARSFRPVATIRVARIRHAGNCDPEPLAWEHLAAVMGGRHQVRLEVSEPVPPANLDARTTPIAAMTGTRAFTLTSGDAAALLKFFSDGGTLIVDAAGGSDQFAESVRTQVLPLVPGGITETLPDDHPIYKPLPKGQMLYRPNYARSLGAAGTKGRLIGVQGDKHLAVIYSPDDLTGGLVGYPCYNLRGYTHETAVDLMISILTHAAGVKLPGK